MEIRTRHKKKVLERDGTDFSIYRIKLKLGVFILLLLGIGSTKAMGQEFFAAVAKVDITPENSQYLAGYEARESTGILDRIYHRIVVLDDGNKQFFLVSSDLGKYDISLYDEVNEQLKKEFKILNNSFWWTVTHTHSAPEVGKPGLSAIFMPERYKQPVASEYTDFVVSELVQGIREALNHLVPARIGIGWGFSKANINRRAIDEKGKASLGLNPDGETDRLIGLLRIDNADGSPLVLIANYPMHGTVLGSASLEISGDAPGIVSEYVEQKLGVPMLFINGAAGDLAPVYSVYPNTKAGHLDQFQVLLGDKILEANRKLTFTTDVVNLTFGRIDVETPRKAGLDWPSYLEEYSTAKAGIHWIKIPVRFVKINQELAIWSAPLELFNKPAKEVRNRSPLPYTFFFGYANGNLRYLPSHSAWSEGGYEISASPFTSSAEKDLTEAVSGYLDGELNRRY